MSRRRELGMWATLVGVAVILLLALRAQQSTTDRLTAQQRRSDAQQARIADLTSRLKATTVTQARLRDAEKLACREVNLLRRQVNRNTHQFFQLITALEKVGVVRVQGNVYATRPTSCRRAVDSPESARVPRLVPLGRRAGGRTVTATGLPPTRSLVTNRRGVRPVATVGPITRPPVVRPVPAPPPLPLPDPVPVPLPEPTPLPPVVCRVAPPLCQ